MSDTDLHQNHNQVGPEPTQPQAGFKPCQRSTQLAKRDLRRHQNLLGTTPLWGQPLNNHSSQGKRSVSIVSQPED